MPARKPTAGKAAKKSAAPKTPVRASKGKGGATDLETLILKAGGKIHPDGGRGVRVYMDGIFDMFHFGHAKALQQPKLLYPNCTLIVGVSSDKDTHKLKGPTVMSEDERYESVRHCKWADEVIEGPPWVLDTAFLAANKIDYVAHDALPYADASGQAGDGDVYSAVKAKGMFLETQRTEGISTTDLIGRIIRSYDHYVQRNLDRGIKREDLNVPIHRAARIKLAGKIAKTRKTIKEKVNKQTTRVRENLGAARARVGKNLDGAKKGVEKMVSNSYKDGKKMMKDFLGVFAGFARSNEALKAANSKKSARGLLHN